MKQLILGCVVCLLGGWVATTPSINQDENPFDWKILKKNLRDYQSAQARIDAAKKLESVAYNLYMLVTDLGTLVRTDRDPLVRRQAAITLQHMGPSARMAAPDLIAAMKKETRNEVRTEILSAVGATAPFSQEAIPLLVEAVNDRNIAVRKRAIAALGAFGPLAKEAVPLLIRTLWDPDKGVPKKEPSVSGYAYLTLRRIDPDAKNAFTVLVRMRKQDPAALRKMAPNELAQLMPKDKKLVPFLAGTLGLQPDQELRAYAAYALGIIGPDAKEAVPDLLKTLAVKDVEQSETAAEIRISVVWALGRIGPSASGAAPALRELREGATEPLRGVLVEALSKIQKDQ